MSHVGKKTGFAFRDPAQEVCSLVQLRVEGHDTAVGIFQFTIELRKFLLPPLEFGHGGEQFLILLPHLDKSIFAGLLSEPLTNLAKMGTGQAWSAQREAF